MIFEWEKSLECFEYSNQISATILVLVETEALTKFEFIYLYINTKELLTNSTPRKMCLNMYVHFRQFKHKFGTLFLTYL